MKKRGQERSGKVGRVTPCAPLLNGSDAGAPGVTRPANRQLTSGTGMMASLGLFCLLLSISAFGQSYSIDWFTIDGGGGTSTGGVYSVTGTLGQPDAGVATGGNYSLIGGFWGAVVPVQQAGAPTLFIANLQNGSVKVTWLPNTPGFVLQEAGTLNPTPIAWTNAPVAYTNGATIPSSMPTRFFRLIKP